MTLTRRQFGQISFAALVGGPAFLQGTISLAGNPTRKPLHGLSAFGDLKYGPDYTHFEYLNPNAPKGGLMNFGIPNWAFNQNPQTFDTFNTLVLKGNAPPRIELIYSALMTTALDEPTALYGAVAESVEISEDRNSYLFRLRSEPRWHDGTPLTAEDVAFTYTLLKEKGHPQIALILKDLVSATVEQGNAVRLTFNGDQSDRTILSAALLPILSKAYYATRTFEDTTMEIPLGSGPYKVGRFNAGSFIEYDRVADYWAADMPFTKGANNFDTLRVEFYKERQPAFEAFKKGEILVRQEFTSKTWATEYDFPAVQEGRVKKELFPSERNASFQAWAVNKRRAKFADPRTVQAIDLCFDFEWTNQNLFYGAYERGSSFFQNSPFKATGKPSGEELALLQSLTNAPDESVFGDAPAPAVSDGSGSDRRLLRQANDLLRQAGWQRQGTQLVDSGGNPFTIEILIRSPTFERILNPFIANMKRLGITGSIRLVDPAQFRQRLDTFDYDMVGRAQNLGALPTPTGLEDNFHSRSADRNGSANLSGLKNATVDELIDRIAKIDNEAELTVHLRALDRVLRSTHSWIPNWNSANHRVAYWDMFGRPPAKPDYGFPIERMWWLDEAKAKAIGKA
ncbi:MAG: extracellular solute-binding protein [Pseudomonadota bacterium]